MQPSPDIFLSQPWTVPHYPGDHEIEWVLQGHAELYDFGEKWQIPRLKTLALHKLYTILKNIKLEGYHTWSILRLVFHAFDDKRTPDKGWGGRDPLADMLVQYIAENIDPFGPWPLFSAHMRQGGPFAQWLWEYMYSRKNPSGD